MTLPSAWGPLLAGCVLGCAGAADEPRPAPTMAVTVGQAPSVVSASASAPASTSATSSSPSAAASAAPKLGRDHRSFVACSADDDCGWDDPCAPTRCVEPQPPAACEETAPAPGACLCVEGACTLKPKTAPIASGACELRGCVVDRAAGTCVADTGGVPENIRFSRPVNVGPSCDCNAPAKGCAFSWFDAVLCKTERDCWVDPSPRRHPVARPAHLRGRDFKPCSDGEVAPACKAGVCALGPAYSC
ncbi:MAG: hypothetical protein IPM79_08695 [Polyangiaceae bacterium]|nr:hypothetical protein [Polyangiaceae bacterium]